MTIQDLKDQNLIVFECLSGSHAYGLQTEHSDIDIKGVYILPEDQFLGLGYTEQVSDEKNDTVYYELRRFMELLSKNNPNILELLYSPDDCLRIVHPVFKPVREHGFLSRLCEHTFGGYAMTQVKKAKGLNKKILNPMDKERKGVLDFCHVSVKQGSVPVARFLGEKGLNQSECGLSRIAHMPDMYGIYHGTPTYKGIIRKEEANDIALSSIPKGAEPIGIMSFNKSAYSSYCKDYKEYWEWVDKRNDQRYQNTLDHGKNYDAKNMMHTLRLLSVAAEIGETGQLNVRRPDREHLLAIKRGEFQYEELLTMAEQKIERIKEVYPSSGLPAVPDLGKINELLISVRKAFYSEKY